MFFRSWFSPEPRAEPALAASPPPAPLDPDAVTLLSLARKLQRNTLLLQNLKTSEDFQLRFDVTPSCTIREMGGILSLESPGASPGTLLEFAFLPQSTTLHCSVARPQGERIELDTSALPVGQTSRVEAQLKGATFTVSIGGIQVCSSPAFASKLPGMEGVRVWASGKQHAAAAASISNVVYKPLGGALGATGASSVAPSGAVQEQPPVETISIPEIPESFPGLANCSQEELEFMGSNNEAVDDWIFKHDQARASAVRLKQLREANAEQAQLLLSFETQCRDMAARCEQGRIAYTIRSEAVEALMERRLAIVQRQSPEHAMAKLGAQAQASDAAAKACLTDVLDQGGALDTAGLARFKEQFLQHKMDKHTRLALRERLLRSG